MAVLALALCLVASVCACSRTGEYDINTRTVMDVGGYKISYDEYRLWYMQCLGDLGEDADEEQIRSETEQIIRRKYAQRSLCDRYGIELTDKDEAEIDEYFEELISQCGGKKSYKVYLGNYYFTGTLYREQYEATYYYDAYLRELLSTGRDGIIKVDRDTVLGDFWENFYRYAVIYIAFDEGDNYLTNRKTMDEIYARLEAGEDFCKLADEYSDLNIDNEAGVYATVGEKLEEIEHAALELECGEHSGIISTADGHYIIKRLELEESYTEKHFDDILEKYSTRRYNEYLESFASELEVSYKGYYKKLTRELLVSSES